MTTAGGIELLSPVLLRKDKQETTSMPLNEIDSIRDTKTSANKRKIIKNLLIICFGLVLLFVAYNGLSMLQSTLNQEQGIGVASQAIIYAAFCVSALLLPKYTIKRLGCKRTLLISMSMYIPYIVANFYFTWFTMVPSAILVGLSASLLWSSQCTYFNESSVIYSNLCFNEIHQKTKDLKNSEFTSHDNENNDVVLKYDSLQNLDILKIKDLQNENMNKVNDNCEMGIKSDVYEEQDKFDKAKTEFQTFNGMQDGNLKHCNLPENKKLPKIKSEEYSNLVSSVTARFFGLFGLIFRSSDIWSNLMSYYVLNDDIVLDNITENGNCSCGASFCNIESNCFSHNLAEPTQQMRNILCGVSVLIACLGIILIFLFLDNLEKEEEPVKFSCNLAMATCKFVRKKEALLLLPLSSYIGLQQGFYIGDFTKMAKLLLVALVGVFVVNGVLASPFDPRFDTHWENFKSVFQKEYKGSEESARRSIWESHVNQIIHHNLEHDLGFHTYRKGLNQYADYSREEFVLMMNGYRGRRLNNSASTFTPYSNIDLPSKVDWRKQGLVTGIKNQQQCGSCWAFSTTGSLEGQHKKKTGKLVSLSEQNLVDCSGAEGNMGCEGGLMDQGFEYIKKNGGIDTEISYPYTAEDGTCKYSRSNVGATVTGFVDVASGDESALQQAVATIGPISVAIDASHESFQLYQSGIYNEPSCDSFALDHGVLAIGYGNEKGQDYWLVKNSWGTSWGIKGYIKMSRNKNNQCGIATQASYPLV